MEQSHCDQTNVYDMQRNIKIPEFVWAGDVLCGPSIRQSTAVAGCHWAQFRCFLAWFCSAARSNFCSNPEAHEALVKELFPFWSLILAASEDNELKWFGSLFTIFAFLLQSLISCLFCEKVWAQNFATKKHQLTTSHKTIL